MNADVTAPPLTLWKRSLRLVRLLLTAGVLLGIALAVTGQIVRDPSVAWAQLFYLPLLPLGVGAILLDLVFAGRCLPKPRFGLTLLGLATTAAAIGLLFSFGGGDPEQPGKPVIGLLHWNVHWGGGRHSWNFGSKHRGTETWASILQDINDRSPDVVVLTEAPESDLGWTQQLAQAHGWATVERENEPGSDYWFRQTVLAPGPLVLEDYRYITHGYLMSVLLQMRGRPLRLLVVDFESNPGLSRPEMLADVVAYCRLAQEMGEPIDLLAGDFNTPRRSRGFDLFAEMSGGYRLASQTAFGWRGTFASNWPLYDIDHVWLRRGLPILGCEFFTNSCSDHRGQLVRFQLP